MRRESDRLAAKAVHYGFIFVCMSFAIPVGSLAVMVFTLFSLP